MTRIAIPALTELIRFESSAQPGTPVQVFWTNCNRDFTAPAVIDRVNRASIRVEITADVPDSREPQKVAYPAGFSIIVPRVLSGRWSHANCCIPADEPAAATHEA